MKSSNRFDLSKISFFLLLFVLMLSFDYCEGQCAFQELNGMTGTLVFSPSNGQVICFRVVPQPSNNNKEVRKIYVQLDPSYDIGDSALVVYNSFNPSDRTRDIEQSFTGMPSDAPLNFTIASPWFSVVLNASGEVFYTFNIKYSADPDHLRTKFGLALFQGAMVVILTPLLFMTISKYTIRRGCCDKEIKKQRLNRFTPKMEQIFVWCGVAAAFIIFFLLLFRVIN